MSFRVKRPSKRAIHNGLQMLDAFANGTVPVFKAPPAPRVRKPRAEREAGATDALKEWRRYRPDVRLWRNNVGQYRLPSGGYVRYGLCNGSSDFIGLKSVTITPGMVGKTVGVFFAVEIKAPGKAADPHQQAWIDEVRTAGAIAGVASNAEDVETLLGTWLVRMVGDER
jgi:hypothetical protein